MNTPPIAAIVFPTDLGFVGIAGRSEAVIRTTLPEPDEDSAWRTLYGAADIGIGNTDAGDDHIQWVASQIQAYCADEPVDLTKIVVDESQTAPFTRKARMACRTIQRGQVRTYRWLATQAGNPKASRAAGRAMATNPVPLLVPCHRVVGSNGDHTGFGGSVGLPLKAQLLRMESDNPELAETSESKRTERSSLTR